VHRSHHKALDAFRRVQGFLDAQATALGSIIPASLRARLDGAVTQLAGLQVEQSAPAGTARGEAVNQAGLRKTFGTQFMRPIARIAKAKGWLSQRDRRSAGDAVRVVRLRAARESSEEQPTGLELTALATFQLKRELDVSQGSRLRLLSKVCPRSAKSLAAEAACVDRMIRAIVC
jgi:hypothetical protein